MKTSRIRFGATRETRSSDLLPDFISILRHWLFALLFVGVSAAERPYSSSYASVVQSDSFSTVQTRMVAEKPAIQERQAALLRERYDLRNDPAADHTMSRGKPIQKDVRVNLAPDVTWQGLAALPAEEIRAKEIFPAGFLPLPHPNHPEGGMLFPRFAIEEILRQEGRDLTRFDLDFDLPDAFLPEFPPPLCLTTRTDLGDVAQGKRVNLDNYAPLFDGILNPKPLEGLRLLLIPFPQQQFNQTNDRRSLRPDRGVACFDCHANGHTNKDSAPYLHDGRLLTPEDTVEFFNLGLGTHLFAEEKQDLPAFLFAL